MAEAEGTGTAGWARFIPKQGTGIVGRLCTLSMVLLGAMGVGVYSIDGTTTVGASLKLAGVLAIAGTGLLILFKLVAYAERNPLHASLEGSELVKAQLRQWEIAEKGVAPVLPTANVAAPPPAAPPAEGAQQ
jgi:hypothetical protein